MHCWKTKLILFVQHAPESRLHHAHKLHQCCAPLAFVLALCFSRLAFLLPYVTPAAGFLSLSSLYLSPSTPPPPSSERVFCRAALADYFLRGRLVCTRVFSPQEVLWPHESKMCVSLRYSSSAGKQTRPLWNAPCSDLWVQLAASGVRSGVASRRGPIHGAHPLGVPQGTSAHLCKPNYGQSVGVFYVCAF